MAGTCCPGRPTPELHSTDLLPSALGVSDSSKVRSRGCQSKVVLKRRCLTRYATMEILLPLSLVGLPYNETRGKKFFHEGKFFSGLDDTSSRSSFFVHGVLL